FSRDWSSDVCSSDLDAALAGNRPPAANGAPEHITQKFAAGTSVAEVVRLVDDDGVGPLLRRFEPLADLLIAAAEVGVGEDVEAEIGSAACRDRAGDA